MPQPKAAWLHITDLHMGMGDRGVAAILPSLKTSFVKDLTEVLDDVGRLDFVVFSGDLVQRASKEEYARLDEHLDAIWEQFDKLKLRPVLFPVPGNHDLVRPDPESPVVQALAAWANRATLREDIFWDPRRGLPYREEISRAFAHYQEWFQRWRSRHPNPGGYVEREGLLPGDLMARYEIGDLCVGLVGLNSSFLHLSDEVRAGGIDVHSVQLNTLCDDDPDKWAKQSALRLLVTHHPPSWLCEAGRERYQEQIVNWFGLHLCGHLHESDHRSESRQGARRVIVHQAASFFGLDDWAEGEGISRERMHGYTMFDFSVVERRRGRLRLWPRRATRSAQRRAYTFAPDVSYELNHNCVIEELAFDDERVKAEEGPSSSASMIEALREQWEGRLEPGLILTLERHVLPYSDEILELLRNKDPEAIVAAGELALERYVSGANHLTREDYFLIANRLRQAIEDDDPAPCRRRPFVYPIHQYLSDRVRRDAPTPRAKAIATLERWLSGHTSVYATARDFAAFELGMCGAESALPCLLVSLGNPFETTEVRYYAAMAIGMLRAVGAVPALLSTYGAPETPPDLQTVLAHVVIFIAGRAKASDGTSVLGAANWQRPISGSEQ
jgi:predicted MPP superfamily phosphohydrolase